MTRKLTTWCAAAVLTAGLAVAQDRMHHGGGPQGGSPDRLEFLALRLNLTDAQKQQATVIFTAAQQAATPVRTNLTAARTALTAAIKANAANAQVDQLSATYGTLTGQLTAIDAKASVAFYALLTAEQKALYDALRGPGRQGGRRGPGSAAQ